MKTLVAAALAVLLLVGAIGGSYGLTLYTLHAQQAAQQRQGQVLERKLCTTLGRLAALQPPAGNPVTNPSRAYDQQVHAALAQLGPDIGCKR